MNVLKAVVVAVFRWHKPHVHAHSIPIPECLNFLRGNCFTINSEQCIWNKL
ncbi:hypothetical protein KPPSC5_03535 [Klebsiella pneumoniae]|nr:hypothetical protein KPPSC5_03535 [Klebsiella pneumoniae]